MEHTLKPTNKEQKAYIDEAFVRLKAFREIMLANKTDQQIYTMFGLSKKLIDKLISDGVTDETFKIFVFEELLIAWKDIQVRHPVRVELWYNIINFFKVRRIEKHKKDIQVLMIQCANAHHNMV